MLDESKKKRLSSMFSRHEFVMTTAELMAEKIYTRLIITFLSEMSINQYI